MYKKSGKTWHFYRDHTLEDRMESFFLAETTKYLYLLFDPDNFVNARGEEAVVVDVEGHGKCVVEAGQYYMYNMRFSTNKKNQEH